MANQVQVNDIHSNLIKYVDSLDQELKIIVSQNNQNTLRSAFLRGAPLSPLLVGVVVSLIRLLFPPLDPPCLSSDCTLAPTGVNPRTPACTRCEFTTPSART